MGDAHGMQVRQTLRDLLGVVLDDGVGQGFVCLLQHAPQAALRHVLQYNVQGWRASLCWMQKRSRASWPLLQWNPVAFLRRKIRELRDSEEHKGGRAGNSQHIPVQHLDDVPVVGLV